jgi:hypothetical protein
LASSTSNNFQITGVQLEQNYQPTPFEQRPIGVELALCQRYFQRLLNGADNGNEMVVNVQATGATAGYGFKPLLMTMRTAPTLTSSQSTDAFIAKNAGGSNIFMTAMTFDLVTPRNCLVNISVASGLVAGNNSIVIANSVTAKIDASAEL